MAEPLLQAGADLFGESQFPSQRSLFTPSAFGRAIDIRQRASLARQSAAGALGMLDAMTKIGDFEQQTRDLSEDTDALRQQARIFRQRQQDEAIRKYEEEAKERELQPQYREMIQSIDPYDPAAPEQYAALYPRIGQVDAKTQSDIAIRMAAAQKFRQDQDTFLRAARGAGFNEQDITERLDTLRKEARANPDAFTAATTALPTFNQTEAAFTAQRRAGEDRLKALKNAVAAGVNTKVSPAENLKVISESLKPVAAKIPGFDAAQFIENPVYEINRIIASEAAEEAKYDPSKYRNKKITRIPLSAKEVTDLLKPFADTVLAVKELEMTPSKEALEAEASFRGAPSTKKSGTPGVAEQTAGPKLDIEGLRKLGEAQRSKQPQ